MLKNSSPKFKDTLLCTGWIVGILLFGGLLWYLTQDVRENRMIRMINAVLIDNNDARRVLSALPNNEKSKNHNNYQRFTFVASSDTAVVMTMYDNTIPSVYAAFVNPDGKIQDILPLDNHSAQAMERIEKTKLDEYKMRLEEKERQIRSEN
jgi:hypothetical protein